MNLGKMLYLLVGMIFIAMEFCLCGCELDRPRPIVSGHMTRVASLTKSTCCATSSLTFSIQAPCLVPLRGGSLSAGTSSPPKHNKLHKMRKLALKSAKAAHNETVIQRVREGEKALDMGNIALALEIFEQEINRSSIASHKSPENPREHAHGNDGKTVQRCDRAGVHDGVTSNMHKIRLVLSHPSLNLQVHDFMQAIARTSVSSFANDHEVVMQAKPIRAGMDLSHNFAQNSNETLQTFLRTFGHMYRYAFRNCCV